jgi:hypothetical protein
MKAAILSFAAPGVPKQSSASAATVSCRFMLLVSPRFAQPTKNFRVGNSLILDSVGRVLVHGKVQQLNGISLGLLGYSGWCTLAKYLEAARFL